MMSHLIKIYAVCKFSYFCLWYLKSYSYSTYIMKCSNIFAEKWNCKSSSLFLAKNGSVFRYYYVKKLNMSLALNN